MATYSDTFTNTDGTPLNTHNANWASTPCTINSNCAIGPGAARLTGIAFSDDQFAQATIGPGYPAYTSISLRVRDNGSTYFSASFRSDRLIVYRGGGTLDTDTSITWAAGDVARIEVQGSEIRVYKNGSLVKTVTDSTTWSGTKAPGFNLQTTVKVDDFSCGDLAASALADPGTPTASSVTRTTATVTWVDNSTGEDGFDVDLAASPYSSWAAIGASPVAANSTSVGLTSLTEGTSYKVRVRASSTDGLSDSAWVESAAFTTLTRKLVITNVHPDAIGTSSVAGVVFAAPTGADITGAKVGEFTGGTFVDASGVAELKVSCASFGGTSLLTSDTPAVYLQTATYNTPVFSTTVVDEV